MEKRFNPVERCGGMTVYHPPQFCVPLRVVVDPKVVISVPLYHIEQDGNTTTAVFTDPTE